METRAESWLHLQELLFSDSWNDALKRHRSSYAFRGVNCAGYKLSTSLMRLGEAYDGMERNLLKQFQKYAHKHVVERDTEWHWLSIAQHHGLPTRLLDWTYSPYVALHFATSDMSQFDKDAAVWMVNYADAHKLLQGRERHQLDMYKANIFSMDMLTSSFSGLDALDATHAQTFKLAIFFEPPTIDDRIINQFAYFSALNDPTLSMDDWLENPRVKGEVRFNKVIIPSALKWEVRDKLDQANINERILFTGLDGLCTWLARHYKPL